jgi:hypothetical protein
MKMPNPGDINRKFADLLSPDARKNYYRVNEPEEAGLMERAEMNEGGTRLENVITLIEGILKSNTNEILAKRLIAELRSDKVKLAAIKEELRNNDRKNADDDKREEIARRVASELTEAYNSAD